MDDARPEDVVPKPHIGYLEHNAMERETLANRVAQESIRSKVTHGVPPLTISETRRLFEIASGETVTKRQRWGVSDE